MRILITSPVLPPELGGPATYSSSLARWLRARGHGVTLLSYAERDALSIEDGVEVRRLRRVSKLVRYQRMYQLCCEELRRHEIVFSSDHLATPLVRALRRVPRPSILRVMIDPAWELSMRYGWSSQDPDAFRHAPSTWRGAFVAKRQRRWWNAFTRLVAPSQYLADVLREYGIASQRIQHIANPFHGRVDDLGESERTSLHLLIVARLANWKRIDLALREFAAFPAAWRLTIVGDGVLRTSLQQLARQLGLAQRVEFLGALPHTEVLQHMRSASALLQTSSYEGLSHTLLEAMAAGLPIVATSVGGNAELLRDGALGMPLSPTPPWHLAQRIPAWIASGAAAAAAREARRVLRSEFDRERIFLAVEDLCRQLIREGVSGSPGF